METVRFQRSGGSKALGCLMYLVAAPVAACLVAILVGLPLFGIAYWLGASDDTTAALCLGSCCISIPIALWWCFHDWRRRAAAEVALHDDRLEVATGGKRVEVYYGEVQAIRLEHQGGDLACVLNSDSGETLRLPTEIAPFSEVQDTLLERLIPVLQERLEEELEEGGTVAIREGTVRAWLRIFHGVFRIMLVPLLILSIRFALRAGDVFRLGRSLIRQGARGRRGGFEITPDGVKFPDALEPRTVPWIEITLTTLDEDGIVLTTTLDETASASPMAENWWPASLWLAEKLARPDADASPSPA